MVVQAERSGVGPQRQLVRLAEVYSAAGTVHEIEVATLPAEAGGLSAGVTVTVGGESFELRCAATNWPSPRST